MRTFKIILLLTVLFFSENQLYAQPGEESDKKYNVHEIKLYEREDGSRAGAIAWTTASPDIVQRFVIRNLSIMEPVQVLLQSLSPDDEITLQFVKEKWSEPEASISAKGKIIGKKIFRTYKTAAMVINANKAGVPYVIFVQVGKKFPVNSTPLFTITNDKEEYENYLKNKGKVRKNRTDSDMAVIPVGNNENGGGNTTNNSSLLYFIIGLLALMVMVLGYFVFFRKGSKKVLVIIFLLGLSINTSWSQDLGPIQVPPVNSGDGSQYTTTGITAMVNQTLIVDLYKRLSEQAAKLSILDDSYNELNDQLNNLEEMVLDNNIDSGETDSELFNSYFELRNEFEAFKNDFVENMPGENTEGGNRIVRESDINRLRNRIRRLEAQVEFLSERDRGYAPPEEDYESEEVVNCDEDPACVEAIKICSRNLLHDMGDVKESFRKLNRIAKHGDWIAESGIATGNAIANSAPGMGLGWQPQLNKIQAARRSLWRTYHDKYDELLERMNGVLDQLQSCLNNAGAEYDIDSIRNSEVDWLEANVPEILTPIM